MRALLFDLDNTLVDRDSALLRALDREFRCTNTTSFLMQLDDHGYASRTRFLAAWSRLSGSNKTMHTLRMAICEQLQPDYALLRELDKLKQQVPIGIITNGGVENQTAKIRSAGLDSIFDARHIWISGGLPFAKPDAGIFHLACTGLNVPTACTVFIGDHPVNDISAASDAGLGALLVTKVIDATFIKQMKEYVW